MLAETLTLDAFGARRAGHPLSLELQAGTVLGVVGPNGVGKSSLLSAVVGTDVTSYGDLHYGSRNLRRLRARERARLISLLPQDLRAPDELRVRELVEVGAFAGGRANANGAAEQALLDVGVAGLRDRRMGTLSGGQRQLVQLARVLAQDTPIVVLDEPTSALDLFHQRAVEQAMRRLGNDGRIVIAALHDLNLALGACTQVLLLDRDGAAHSGPPAEVLRPDLVHAVYGVRTTIHTTPGGRDLIAPAEH